MSKLAVWKYPHSIEDQFVIELPKGAEILSLQVQHGTPTLWALCSVDAPKESRSFLYVGTGHEHPTRFFRGLAFIGTVQIEGGGLVFHLFEETHEGRGAPERG